MVTPCFVACLETSAIVPSSQRGRLLLLFFKCGFNVVVAIRAFSVYTSDSQQEVTEGVFGPFIVWKKLQYC